MSMENNIQTAQELYDKWQYHDSFVICLELIKAEGNKMDAFLLTAKCLLYLNGPDGTSSFDKALKSFGCACSEASSIEEVLELEQDFCETIFERQREDVQEQLSVLEANPTLNQYKEYIPLQLKYATLIDDVSIKVRDCEISDAYCQKKGIEITGFSSKVEEEFGDRYKVSNEFTDEERYTLEYNTALRIFESTQLKLSANSYGNKEFISKLIDDVIGELLTARCIVRSSLSDKEKYPDIYCERKKTEADITRYMLNAQVYHPNGSLMSVFFGDRAEDVEDLKEIYAEIQSIDSQFEVPILPSVEPIYPAQIQTQTQSGGGCYVATAVYGSYDCPEVWTLRRFRDYTLSETWYGRAFICAYYAISPTLVKWFGKTEWFKNLWKPTLDHMVEKLNGNGVEDTPYDDRAWQ